MPMQAGSWNSIQVEEMKVFRKKEKQQEETMLEKLDEEEEVNYVEGQFEIKKSLFATTFALFICLTIIFIVLYYRCYTLFDGVVERKDFLHKKYDICEQCHSNGFCSNDYNTTFRCYCRPGFFGNGLDRCEDVAFALTFRRVTINGPQLDFTMSETNSLTFCLWFKLFPSRNAQPLFSYVSNNNREKIVVTLTEDRNQIEIQQNQRVSKFPVQSFPIEYWSHMCLSWQSSGKVRVYMNGRFSKEVLLSGNEITDKIAESTGKFYLGRYEESKNQSFFLGEMSQFFLYKKLLSGTDMVRLHKNIPPVDGVLVSWDLLRNKTHQIDITETNFLIM